MKNREIYSEAVKLLPERIREIFIKAGVCISGYVKEIRLYSDLPVVVYTDKGRFFLTDDGTVASFYSENTVKTRSKDLQYTVSNACGFSLYSFEKELVAGYIPYIKGIRIGVGCYKTAGGFSPENISSVNIRLPFNCTDNLDFDLYSLISKGGVLIAGAPMSGKTTVLKACCRELSDLRKKAFKKVCIIDSRGELFTFSADKNYYAADIIGNTDKADGILRALHFMSPEIIVCDEIGSENETRSILEGMNGGAVFIAAMHCNGIKELVKREQFRILFSNGVFGSVVMLSPLNPGITEKIYYEKEVRYEIGRHNAYLLGVNSYGSSFDGENA